MKRLKVVAVVAVVVIALVALVWVGRPSFLFGLSNSALEFRDVYLRVSVSPNTILFADEFKIKAEVTFDAREFKAEEVGFFAPTKGLVVREEKTEKAEKGSVVTVAKTLEVQCLSCLPREEPYDLGEYAVVLLDKKGELLQKFYTPHPQIRVSGRVLPQDIQAFPTSLRPRSPVVMPISPGMGLIPYFVFLGTVFSVLGIAILAAVWFLPKHKIPEVPVAVRPRFQDELESAQRILDDLKRDTISPGKAAAQCYRILKKLQVDDEGLGKNNGELLAALEPLAFGSPEDIDVESLQDIVSRAINLIAKAIQKEI